MTAEDEAWLRLAAERCMSTDEVQEAYSYSQFLAVQEFRSRELNHRKPEHFYWAQIVQWIVWANIKAGSPMPDINKFLIQFETGDSGEEEVDTRTPEQIAADKKIRLDMTKAFWKTLGKNGQK